MAANWVEDMMLWQSVTNGTESVFKSISWYIYRVSRVSRADGTYKFYKMTVTRVKKLCRWRQILRIFVRSCAQVHKMLRSFASPTLQHKIWSRMFLPAVKSLFLFPAVSKASSMSLRCISAGSESFDEKGNFDVLEMFRVAIPKLSYSSRKGDYHQSSMSVITSQIDHFVIKKQSSFTCAMRSYHQLLQSFS